MIVVGRSHQLLRVESFGETHNISKEDLGRDENILIAGYVLPFTVPRLSDVIEACSPRYFSGAHDQAPSPTAVVVPHDRRHHVARVVGEVLDMKMIWLQCGVTH